MGIKLLNKAAPPKVPFYLELGDWVCESMADHKRVSPPMYVVGIWTNGVYLEIDPEQGDPFEADYKDIIPIKITDEILANNKALGKHIVNSGKVFITNYGNLYKATFLHFNHDMSQSQTAFMRYVHELQHFYRQIDAGKEIKL